MCAGPEPRTSAVTPARSPSGRFARSAAARRGKDRRRRHRGSGTVPHVDGTGTGTHVKLDELVAVTSGASNRAIGIERANEAEIDRMREALEDRVDRSGEDDPSPSESV